MEIQKSQPLPPQVEPTVQAPVVPPSAPPKPKGLLIMFLVLFVILLSFSAAGYFAYQYVQLKNQVSQVKPTPTMSPSSVQDVTMNWKTYNDTKYGFSFKYPPEKASVVSTGGRTTVQLIGLFNLMYFDSDPNTDFCAGSVPIAIPEITTIMIDGEQYPVTGCGFAEGGMDGGGSVTSYVATIKPNLKIVIIKTYEHIYDSNRKEVPTKQTSPEQLQLATQILSTFQFTAGKKIVTERKFGYIKAITPNYDTYNLSVDLAQFINDNNQPNGYRIDNPSNELTTLPLEQDPSVTLQTFSYASDGNFNFNQSVNFSVFLSRFQSSPMLSAIPYWIDLENGTVTKITEQYLP